MTDSHAQQSNDVLQGLIRDVHARWANEHSGEVADYIPELGKADGKHWGLAVATPDGGLWQAGDAEVPFTIQSVSKACTYCLALELAGRETVISRVGVEPSGDAFNAIEFDPSTLRPFNPMVNAGAITVAGVLYERHGDDAFDFLLERLSIAAGRQLDMDEAVYRSESATGHRNRAIGHLLRGAGALPGPVEAVVDLYFRQCSIRVTAVDLAWIGATLANLGEHPRSGRQAFTLDAIRDTMAVMLSCGMYNHSGSWLFKVGFPAKSGVGGGLLGVIHRQLGLGAYAPKLDTKGNPVRALHAFEQLSGELGLHAFDYSNTGSSLLNLYLGTPGTNTASAADLVGG